jgi:hypothetical protein
VQCGDSEDDASSGETPPASDITLDNFPKPLADAMCQGADSCCRSVSYSSSLELCRETVEGIPRAYQWDMYLADGEREARAKGR